MDNQHFLDPEKVSRVLGVRFRHPRIPDEDDEYKKLRYDSKGFIFDLPNDHTLTFHSSLRSTVNIFQKKGEYKFRICIERITGVKYLYKYKILILDIREEHSYSQFWISANGAFRMSVGLPIEFYHENAWINVMGDGKNEETIRLS